MKYRLLQSIYACLLLSHEYPFSEFRSKVQPANGQPSCPLFSSWSKIFHSCTNQPSSNESFPLSAWSIVVCEPQDLGYTPEKSKPMIIGSHNHFKENVNISRGVKTSEGTIIGDNNYFMSGFHAGHDVIIGSHNIFTSNAVVAGHVVMGDRIFLSGLAAVHQFVNIGDYAMIAGCAKVTKDIPPSTTADGNPARIIGLNSVGLRRGGFSSEARKAIKKTYQTIYHSGHNVSQALAVLEGNIYSEEEERIAAFFLNSERGVTAHK